MKKHMAKVAIALVMALPALPLALQAATIPYGPEADARFQALEAGTSLATGSITSAKILDGTIAAADLGTSAVTSAIISDGTVSSTDILDGTVALADMASGAVNSAVVLDASLTGADMANSASGGTYIKKVAVAVWDPSSDADQGSSTVNGGAHSLGVALPAAAIITDSWAQVVTQAQTAGGATLAISCEDAGNIFAAADISSKTGLVSLDQSGPNATGGNAADMVASIGATCNITATIAVSDYSAGKWLIFVEYLVGE